MMACSRLTVGVLGLRMRYCVGTYAAKLVHLPVVVVSCWVVVSGEVKLDFPRANLVELCIRTMPLYPHNRNSMDRLLCVVPSGFVNVTVYPVCARFTCNAG